MTREHYDQELADLRGSVVAMASMIDKAIDNAVDGPRRSETSGWPSRSLPRIARSTSTAGGPRSKRSW